MLFVQSRVNKYFWMTRRFDLNKIFKKKTPKVVCLIKRKNSTRRTIQSLLNHRRLKHRFRNTHLLNNNNLFCKISILYFISIFNN